MLLDFHYDFECCDQCDVPHDVTVDTPIEEVAALIYPAEDWRELAEAYLEGVAEQRSAAAVALAREELWIEFGNLEEAELEEHVGSYQDRMVGYSDRYGN